MQQKKKRWTLHIMAKLVEKTRRRNQRKRKRKKNTMKKNTMTKNRMSRTLKEVRI